MRKEHTVLEGWMKKPYPRNLRWHLTQYPYPSGLILRYRVYGPAPVYHIIGSIDLMYGVLGWRWHVAQAVKEMRKRVKEIEKA
jgi:hypothetical protein